MDLADADLTDWPGLIALLLPRTLRAGWNLMVVFVVTLGIGLPHLLTIRLVAIEGRGQDYFWYAVTLPWWLAVTGFPALIVARHVAARRRSAS